MKYCIDLKTSKSNQFPFPNMITTLKNLSHPTVPNISEATSKPP